MLDTRMDSLDLSQKWRLSVASVADSLPIVLDYSDYICIARRFDSSRSGKSSVEENATDRVSLLMIQDTGWRKTSVIDIPECVAAL